MTDTELVCACGKTSLRVRGKPIVAVECCCSDCRAAGQRFEHLPQARPILTRHGATHFVLFRKDRVQFLAGTEHLKAHRLTEKSGTRRVLATCCNTPVFLDLKGGHWLSVFGILWPETQRPPITMRTMTKDLAPGMALPPDVPNPGTHTLSFYGKLLLAWAAMGFRAPTLHIPGKIDA